MRKTILVTGSSHGIGAATVEAFSKDGYDVGINYCHSPNDAMEVAARCRALGADAQVYRADVSKREDCERMLNAFIDHFGHIDVLVNNAGGALKMPKGGFVDMPMEYWDDQIALNLSSAAYCSHVAAKNMIEECRSDSPWVAHGEHLTATCHTADYIATIPHGRTGFQYISHVYVFLDILCNLPSVFVVFQCNVK